MRAARRANDAGGSAFRGSRRGYLRAQPDERFWPLNDHALPARAVAVGAAREYVRDRLAGALLPEKVAEAELLTSELVTNAIQHAGLPEGTPIGLDINVDDRRVRVRVVDAGSGFDVGKRLRGSVYPAESGWGLYLVEKVADRWGNDETHPHSVWFEIDREE
jgi:anti-sigma regulatory factor (Ser/Thr protein kinase)